MHRNLYLKLLACTAIILMARMTSAQQTVTIGSEALNEKSVLMLISPSGNQGLILPVAQTKESVNPGSAEKGMIVFDDSDDKVYLWDGNAWQDLVGSGSVSVSHLDDLTDVNTIGATSGQVLKWNGTAWAPATDDAGGPGGTDSQTLSFNTTTKVLSIQNGNNVDLSSLIGTGDGWGTQAVERDNSLQGNGTAASPLGLAPQGAASGQVLKWDGGKWVPANDNVAGGGGAVNASPRLSGDGSAGSPLDIARQGAGTGQVLKWDGSNWSPADDQAGAGGATYSAGTGIAINGSNVISNTGDADSDPANELQDISFDAGTNQLSISGGSTVTLPSGGTDADADPTNEIQTIAKSGNTVTLSNSGGSFTDEVNDADSDPANELQDISFNAGTNQLSISGGSTVTLPSGGTDADADPTNEIQTIAKSGNTVTLSNSGGSFTDEVNDADSNPANELQNLSLTGTTINISGGSGVDLAPIIPPGGTDNQNLTFNTSTNALSIEDGNSVDLSSLAGGGSSVWSANGDKIFYNTDNVGIGLDNPQAKLHLLHNSGVGMPHLLLTEDDTDYARLTLNNSTGHFWTVAARNDEDIINERFNIFNSRGGDIFSLTGNGRLGIGVGTNPKSTLDIKGGMWDVGTTEGDLRIGTDTHRLKIGVATGGGGAGDVRIRAMGGSNRLLLGGGANSVMEINETNVGIGVFSPGGKLHIKHPFISPILLLESEGGDRSSVKFSKTGSSGYWDMVAGIRTDPASGTMSYYYVEDGFTSNVMTMRGNGKVGINNFEPETALDILGGQWNLDATEGDVRIGNAAYRLKIGVALGGGGAGTVRIRAKGGVNQLRLGANDNDVIIVKEDAIEVNGEVNRTPTGLAHMLPIAYGQVNANGTFPTGVVANGSGNFTVNKVGIGQYEVYVNGQSFYGCTAIVSRIAKGHAIHSYGGAYMAVSTYDFAGTLVDAPFSFLIFKP
jgi:hypothetical protein